MGSGAQTSQSLFALGAGQNPCPPLPELDAAVVCLQLFLSTWHVWGFFTLGECDKHYQTQAEERGCILLTNEERMVDVCLPAKVTLHLQFHMERTHPHIYSGCPHLPSGIRPSHTL